ncbi:MAG: flagellar filament outer layer protein FlaA [Spirochaetia bacterium]|nr:flagellar filament outer layer protein FlaA [Spirochaetota bacterium]MDW8111744.1 flagellar filament outer layer protein FlaA [Spirochaetia bacterium]
MKRITILILAFSLFFGVGGYSQQGQNNQQNQQQTQQTEESAEYLKGFKILGEPTEAEIKDTAKQMIQPVLVEDFEVPGDWEVQISRDFGVVSFMNRDGFPKALADIKDKNNKVFGVKINFFKRGPAEILIRPVRQIKIPGITKKLKLWVVGRNYTHTLRVVVRDYLGREKEVTIGKINFSGWKLLEVNIPEFIEQENYKVSEERGLSLTGIKIVCDMTDIVPGRPFYIYFDYLTAETDLFVEKFREIDDMSDLW